MFEGIAFVAMIPSINLRLDVMFLYRYEVFRYEFIGIVC